MEDYPAYGGSQPADPSRAKAEEPPGFGGPPRASEAAKQTRLLIRAAPPARRTSAEVKRAVRQRVDELAAALPPFNPAERAEDLAAIKQARSAGTVAGRYGASVEDNKRRRQTRTSLLHPRRMMRQIEIGCETQRREMEAEGETVTVEDNDRIAEDVLREVVKQVHRDILDGTPLDRRGISTPRVPHELHDLVVQGAALRTRYFREVDQRLRAPAGHGPETSHKLPAAMIERVMLDPGFPALLEAWRGFSLAFPLMELAYRDPFDPSAGGLAWRTAYQAISGVWSPSANRWMSLGMLNRADPDFLLDLSLLAWVELRTVLGLGTTDVVLATDGTVSPARHEQRQSVSRADEQMLNRGRSVGFGTHGSNRAFERGLNMLHLLDPVAGVALTVRVFPFREREHPHLIEALKDLVARAKRLRIDLQISAVVGDKEFCYQDVAEYVVRRMGADLITEIPKRADIIAMPYGRTRGIATCNCGGKEHYMRQITTEGWFDAARRAEIGLEPGKDIVPYLQAEGIRWRVRYRCRNCRLRVDLKPTDAPHLYRNLPPDDVHNVTRDKDRFWLQEDLRRVGRSRSESYNNSVKLAGLARRGSQSIQWVRTDREAEWAAYGRNLGHSVRVLVRHNGSIRAMYDDAKQFGALDPEATRRRWEAQLDDHPS